MFLLLNLSLISPFQAYEKRQRGEQEEEEAEDEIFSHKAVVTKFLNKVFFYFLFFSLLSPSSLGWIATLLLIRFKEVFYKDRSESLEVPVQFIGPIFADAFWLIS